MRPLMLASRVFARLHRWHATAFVLSLVPLERLDTESMGRLTYALMMDHRRNSGRAHRLLHRVMRRNAGISPALRIELAAMATAVCASSLATKLLSSAAAAATDEGTLDAAQRLLAASRDASDGALQAKVAAHIDGLALPPGNDLLTLVPVSGKYLEFWQLWLQQVRRHVGGQVLALALDDAALTALSHEPDVSAVDAREFFAWNARGQMHPRTRGVLWFLRVLYLRDLVHRGHSVLVLDLDAIAVGDLQPMLANLPQADVVAQKDHSIPMDVDRQLGFVLCCGFMLWRPTVASRRLLNRFAEETAVERDDQLALNHLLSRDGLTDRMEDTLCLRFQSAGVQFVCPDPSMVSRTLHRGSVVRHFQQQGKSVAELRSALGLPA